VEIIDDKHTCARAHTHEEGYMKLVNSKLSIKEGT
jgi:hypothetical protein